MNNGIITYYHVNKSRGGWEQLAIDLKLEALGIPWCSYWVLPSAFNWN